MHAVRVLLAAAALAAAVAPHVASADGRCKPYFYESEIAGQPVTLVDVVC